MYDTPENSKNNRAEIALRFNKNNQHVGTSIHIGDREVHTSMRIAGSSPDDAYIITKLSTATAGAAASYKLQKYISRKGEAYDIPGSAMIDIPDDFVITSGSVEYKSEHGDWGDAGTYIRLILENTQGSKDVYINVDGLSAENGLPPGGSAGDILTKRNGSDFAVEWITPASSADQDNTRPITAAAVYTEIGNINALLATI